MQDCLVNECESFFSSFLLVLWLYVVVHKRKLFGRGLKIHKPTKYTFFTPPPEQTEIAL